MYIFNIETPEVRFHIEIAESILIMRQLKYILNIEIIEAHFNDKLF